MPVDDRPGDPGPARDSLDRDGVKSVLADDLLGHVEQLLAALIGAHPRPGDVSRRHRLDNDHRCVSYRIVTYQSAVNRRSHGVTEMNETRATEPEASSSERGRDRDRRQRLLRARDGQRLKRSGRDDFVILERAHEVGGTWRENTYPGCAATCPATSTRSRSRPTRTGRSTFSGPARDPRLPATRRGRGGSLRDHVRFGCEVEGARWDAGGRALAARDLERADRRPRAWSLRAGPLHEPKLPDIPGLREFEGPIFHSATWDHDHDLAASGSRWSAPAPARSSSCRRSSPRSRSCTCSSAPRPGSCPAATGAMSRFERARLQALPGAAAADALGDLLGAARRSRSRCCGSRWHRRCELAGAAHLRRQVPDPELRAKLTPRLPAGLQADPGRQRLPARAVGAQRRGRHRRDRGGPRAARSSARTGPSARSTRSSSAPASGCSTRRSPIADPRRRGPFAGRALGRQPASPPRDDGRRAFRTCSSCSGRTPASGTTRWS